MIKVRYLKLLCVDILDVKKKKFATNNNDL